MNRLKYYKEQISKVEDSISVLKKSLATEYERQNTLIEELQNECIHPEEFIDTKIHYGDEPLEADDYLDYCLFCGKVLDKGYISGNPRGKYSYGKHTYNKGIRK